MLVTLVNCQLLEEEGRARGARATRSLGERSVTELILQHQNPQQLSANLWAAVRARGCQFLGPAMQEEVLNFVLMALDDGSPLSRKVLVMFVVQRLEPHFPQASKTSIGHVVQLLYRASCFKVTKRDGDSSLMQLKEDFRTYETLRREHDTQIVQIATEGGLRIAPDQWSSLLYGDSAHKSHMQSIIDKLQTPQSFGQSVQELVIALQRTGDPGSLASLRPQLDILTNVDPSPESDMPDWSMVMDSLHAAKEVVAGLVNFCAMSGAGSRKSSEAGGVAGHVARYKTSMCRDLASRGSCPRGHNCTFAHSQQELEMHRGGAKKNKSREPSRHQTSPVMSNRQQQPGITLPPQNRLGDPAEVKPFTPSASIAGAPPVAQVAPIPRVIARDVMVQDQSQVQHVAPLVDMNGSPMIDATTGQPLVAASPLDSQQVQVYHQGPVHIAGAEGGFYAVQPGTPYHLVAGVGVAGAVSPMMAAPPIAGQQQSPAVHVPGLNMGPPAQQGGHQFMQNTAIMPQQEATHVIMQNAMIPQQPVPATQQETPRRDMKHDLSPEIASKSLSALKDRKEEILSELGNIVGTSAANCIGDMASQQAENNEKYGMDLEPPVVKSRRNSLQNVSQESQAGTYGMWTSKPLVTMSALLENVQGSGFVGIKPDEDLHPLPEGMVVSRFGPISRKPVLNAHKGTSNTEPKAVTAALGINTRSTSMVRQPLPATSPVPDSLMPVQAHSSVLEYDPGCFTDWYIKEGMDSVAMSHLVNPPLMPISPLPNPRDPNSSRLNNQNLSMYAESTRIQKELQDLQRRISCLSVAENNNQMAIKRDRLAIELRMIESGIRERHIEIHQNQTYPNVVPNEDENNPGHHISQPNYGGFCDHPTQDHEKEPSPPWTTTPYSYW